jgi:hypothetical protein
MACDLERAKGRSTSGGARRGGDEASGKIRIFEREEKRGVGGWRASAP